MTGCCLTMAVYFLCQDSPSPCGPSCHISNNGYMKLEYQQECTFGNQKSSSGTTAGCLCPVKTAVVVTADVVTVVVAAVVVVTAVVVTVVVVTVVSVELVDVC